MLIKLLIFFIIYAIYKVLINLGLIRKELTVLKGSHKVNTT